MTTADEENEVQENVASSCVVLPGRLNMLRGIRAVEICIEYFCLCYQLLFQPYTQTPLLQSKPPPTFQTVNNYNEGLCDVFPGCNI